MSPELARCDAEIAAIRKRAELEPVSWPAYLFVLGEFDWMAERDLIDDGA